MLRSCFGKLGGVTDGELDFFESAVSEDLKNATQRYVAPFQSPTLSLTAAAHSQSSPGKTRVQSGADNGEAVCNSTLRANRRARALQP